MEYAEKVVELVYSPLLFFNPNILLFESLLLFH